MTIHERCYGYQPAQNQLDELTKLAGMVPILITALEQISHEKINGNQTLGAAVAKGTLRNLKLGKVNDDKRHS